MSDTESFESVIERVNAEIAEIEAEDRPFPYRLSANVLRNLRDRLRRAHNREIRDTAQHEYDRGFRDGEHSMDAEHRAVAMRLRQLPLDGGSVENVFNIARAVYHNDFGWAANNCAGLRDELVRLMGGVSDGTAEPMTTDEFIRYVEEDTRRLKGDGAMEVSDDTSIGAGGGACAADGCGCAGEQTEVGDGQNNTHRDGCYNNSQRSSVQGHSEEVEHGGAAHDCADDSRGGNGGGDLHMAGVTYDVLWNERRMVIAKLRKIPDVAESSYTYDEHLAMIYDALDVEAAPWSYIDLDEIRDRLIHLLGGDQPSGIDVLREMDAESDTDGTCPNDVRTSSITDELREFVGTFSKRLSISVAEVNAIADRIDAQFDRICKQQEAVLQSTIDGMVKEYEYDRLPDQLRIEKLEKQRDHWRQQATDLMNHADAMEHERDELQAKLDGYERTHMRLPRDKDGIYIDVADTVRINDRKYGVYAVSNRNVWINPFDDDLYRLYGYPADECSVVKKGDAINGRH